MSHPPVTMVLAFVAFVCLALSIVLGGAVSGRLVAAGARPRLYRLHHGLGEAALVSGGLHVATVIGGEPAVLDAMPRAAFLAGLGALAAMVGPVLGFAGRRRLGRRAWRPIHAAGYAAVVLAGAHALGAHPTPPRRPEAAVYVAGVAAVAVVALARLRPVADQVRPKTS